MNQYETLDDTELWAFLQSGDRKALELIYRRHYPYLYNYGIKICGDADVIQDCIHDLFLKLSSRRYDQPVNNIRYYLLRAMKNILLNRLEQDRKISLSSIDNIPFDFIVSDELLQNAYPHNDEDIRLIRNIKSAYNSLSDKQKHIMYLRFIMELSYNEISGILNMESQSAMNLLSRTLSKMRELLKKK